MTDPKHPEHPEHLTNEAVPAKLLRNLVLRVSNNLPPVKKLITRQLTG